MNHPLRLEVQVGNFSHSFFVFFGHVGWVQSEGWICSLLTAYVQLTQSLLFSRVIATLLAMSVRQFELHFANFSWELVPADTNGGSPVSKAVDLSPLLGNWGGNGAVNGSSSFAGRRLMLMMMLILLLPERRFGRDYLRKRGRPGILRRRKRGRRKNRGLKHY